MFGADETVHKPVPAPPHSYWSDFEPGLRFPVMEAPADLAADLRVLFGPCDRTDPMTPSLSLRALNRATLACQYLLNRVTARALDVIEHLAGMQSQAPLAPYIGLWARLHGFDRLGLRGVLGHRPQLVGVGAGHVGQHVRVAGIALGLRHPEPVPEPGRLQRVDRRHGLSSRDQRPHPRGLVGLDPDEHLHLVGVVGGQSTRHPCNRVIPATPSGTRALASRRPEASITSTSWWSSVQSSPTNSRNVPPLLAAEHLRQREGEPPAA